MNYFLIIPMAIITLFCIVYRIKNEKDIFNIYIKGIVHVFIFLLCYATFIELENSPFYVIYIFVFLTILSYFSKKYRYGLLKIKLKQRYGDNPELVNEVIKNYKYFFDKYYIYQIWLLFLVYIIEFYIKL